MVRVMIFGMSLATFTMVHVIISLIGIVTGSIVMFAMFGSHSMPVMTAIFLLFTILTSATGFLFPFTRLLPSHMIGILSLALLAIACIALYGMKLSRPWRWIYVVTFGLALPQCLRAGDPGLPQGAAADGAGAWQSAVRYGVRSGARLCVAVLHRGDCRHRQTIPAGLIVPASGCTGVLSFSNP
jgi:4-amino-4-deoxy-L-arabinose transferase-like glycosyltransferase